MTSPASPPFTLQFDRSSVIVYRDQIFSPAEFEVAAEVVRMRSSNSSASVPTHILAQLFSFQKREFFEIESEVKR